MTGPQRSPWPSLDATLARIEAVLAEPEPGSPWASTAYWEGTRWRMAAAGEPPSPWEFIRAADRSVLDGGVVIASPDAIVTVPARKYVAPLADTRPGWIGRLRRRLFGEPPQ